jgi:hypothetical protein
MYNQKILVVIQTIKLLPSCLLSRALSTHVVSYSKERTQLQQIINTRNLLFTSFMSSQNLPFLLKRRSHSVLHFTEAYYFGKTLYWRGKLKTLISPLVVLNGSRLHANSASLELLVQPADKIEGTVWRGEQKLDDLNSSPGNKGSFDDGVGI